MSKQTGSFSFPPPPPPPPPPKFHNQGGDNFNGPSSRGRGMHHGQRGMHQSSRGRGYGRGRGGGGMARTPHYSPQSFQSSQNQRPNSMNQPHKRTFGSAFGGSGGAPAKPKPLPQAPAAVPSFNASLENLLPCQPVHVPALALAPAPASTATRTPSQGAPKKANILGLTPSQDEGSESEENDGDEEARLGPGISSGQMQIEYKGNVSTLRTPEDIAAWIAERRRRYPTQAKREAAQKEAEEKKKKYEEEKKARQEAQRQAREQRERERKEKLAQMAAAAAPAPAPAEATATAKGWGKKEKSSRESSTDLQAQARLRAEKLRRKLEKAERKLAALDGSSAADRKHAATTGDSVVEVECTITDSNPTMSSSDKDDDDTSSSGSDSDSNGDITSDSDSDSDSAPEELSSKIEPEPIIAASKPATETATAVKVCSFFARGGRRCKYGDRCRYSHVRGSTSTGTGPGAAEPTRKPKTAKVVGRGIMAKRKGLWDLLVEKEQEDENKKVLQAIIALGDAGMLEDKKDKDGMES